MTENLQMEFTSQSSGLWHHVVLQYDTNDLEGLDASIFRVKCVVPRSGLGYKRREQET